MNWRRWLLAGLVALVLAWLTRYHITLASLDNPRVGIVLRIDRWTGAATLEDVPVRSGR